MPQQHNHFSADEFQGDFDIMMENPDIQDVLRLAGIHNVVNYLDFIREVETIGHFYILVSVLFSGDLHSLVEEEALVEFLTWVQQHAESYHEPLFYVLHGDEEEDDDY